MITKRIIVVYLNNINCYNLDLSNTVKEESCIRVNIRELDKVPIIVFTLYMLANSLYKTITNLS